MRSGRWNLGIGVLALVAGIVALVVWIPEDTETGVLMQDRYSVEIGDGMAPTMSMIGVLVVSIALIAVSCLQIRSGASKADEDGIGIPGESFAAMAAVAASLAVSLTLMVWAGPLAVVSLQAGGVDIGSYRELSDTVPYKYIGFSLGGFVLVFSLIAWMEGRPSWRAAWTAAAAVIALILVYDVPFDNLLLPANGSH